mgnify:CR=1 FL=1
MRTLLSLALIGLFFSISAQETINYPYNPDGDVDGTIASPDLLDILGVYGNAFTPTEIQIDGVGLLEVIQDLQNQIASIQLIDMNYVESTLAAHQQEIEVLQAENETLQTNNATLTQQVLDLQSDVIEVYSALGQQEVVTVEGIIAPGYSVEMEPLVNIEINNMLDYILFTQADGQTIMWTRD